MFGMFANDICTIITKCFLKPHKNSLSQHQKVLLRSDLAGDSGNNNNDNNNLYTGHSLVFSYWHDSFVLQELNL